ncbi:hypothetical protein RND71_034127 [Anisodus tanguticus]|uniref:Uncharacterized protein n=1 Tax=Anisodus tanguticus TaxID=243964 RepID=A0AAE1RA31_9SOLA|nr:hypothetical protein RND71_034127 [Anisodus tanguticus]
MGTVRRKLNWFDQAMEELIRSQPTDDQGNIIMPSEEQTISCWLDVVGGMYKGRAYGLSSEKNFHRLQCGLQGIGSSARYQMSSLRRCDMSFGSLLGLRGGTE